MVIGTLSYLRGFNLYIYHNYNIYINLYIKYIIHLTKVNIVSLSVHECCRHERKYGQLDV